MTASFSKFQAICITSAIASAVVLSLFAILSSANAATLDFSFSFTNDPANGGGSIEGIIRGLEDNLADQAAFSVEVTANTTGIGIGEYIGTAEQNEWTVLAGEITNAAFYAHPGPGPQRVLLGLYYIGPADVNAYAVECLALDANCIINVPSGTDLHFGLVAAVPLPPAVFLLGTAVAGLAGFNRLRRRREMVEA